MSDETLVNGRFVGDDTSATLTLTVDGDVQLTVILNKPGNQGSQREIRREAAIKAVELLLLEANRGPV